MRQRELVLVIGKVIIAAAWADGELRPEEVNSLKDLLFRLPGLTGREWRLLEMYMATPVGEEERARLVQELRDAVHTPEDRALALGALDDLVLADGEISPEERRVTEEIRVAVQEVAPGVLGRVAGWIRGPLARRLKSAGREHTREEEFEDFLHNRVYFAVRRHPGYEEAQFALGERELRKLALAGALMARVAYVDQEVTEEEFDAMVDSIGSGWELPREQAAVVAEAAISEWSAGMDEVRLVRRFFELTTEEERRAFLDVLFAIADGDGKVTYEEMEEIRAIARSLKLGHEDFIQAKVRIPRERRAT